MNRDEEESWDFNCIRVVVTKSCHFPGRVEEEEVYLEQDREGLAVPRVTQCEGRKLIRQ